MKSVSTSGESSKSLLKRPKLANPNPSSAALTKRASTGGTLVKMEKDNVKTTTGKQDLFLIGLICLHFSEVVVYICICKLSVLS